MDSFQRLHGEELMAGKRLISGTYHKDPIEVQVCRWQEWWSARLNFYLKAIGVGYGIDALCVEDEMGLVPDGIGANRISAEIAAPYNETRDAVNTIVADAVKNGYDGQGLGLCTYIRRRQASL